MIGDDIETDIEASKNLGAETIYVNSDKIFSQEAIEKANPNFIVNDLNEVIEILKSKFI